MRIAVLYGTDYGAVSPGGIQNFIKLLGGHVPPGIEVTYVGIGQGVEVPPGAWESLGLPPRRLPLHSTFAVRLAARRHRLRDFDVLVSHRPEYLLAVKHPRHVLVLHGGTWNAWRTGRRTFGLFFLLVQFLAAWRAERVISVDVAGTWGPVRRVARRLFATAVPANPVFSAAPAVAARKRLISTSRLVREKGVEQIVDLAERVGWPLDIYGAGPEEAVLRDLATKSSVPVTLHGAKTPEELASAYAQGGVFVTCGRAEGYPLACVEAMAAGLPVVGLVGAGLPQLAPYGAILVDSLEELVGVIAASDLCVDHTTVREAHDPAVVSRTFWENVTDGACGGSSSVP